MAKPITLPRRHMIRAAGLAGLLSTSVVRRVQADRPKPRPTDDPFLSGYYAPIHGESASGAPKLPSAGRRAARMRIR